MPLSFYSPALDLSIKILESCGVDPQPLMRELAIDPRKVSDFNARFRMDQVLAFYDRAETLLPSPACGLRAHRFWHPTQMGALGYAWMTSDTLRTALKRLVRYSKIVSEGVELELSEDAGRVILQSHFLGDQALHFREDISHALLLAMMQTNAGQAFHPEEVIMSHAPPDDTGPYYELFRCPVAFGRPDNGFIISAEEADKPRSCANSQLAALHDHLMRDYLARLDKENLIERVKAAIVDALPSGQVSDATIAKALYMTERTLQRRLREQGTTFKQLLTEVRRELADQYIRNSRMSLQEISFLLGFSELSSFSRAFKRWTGMAPRDYRTHH